MRRTRLPSPAFAVAALALFFALGGSAFALGKASAVTYQPRCAQGAVRGVAVVRGDGVRGMVAIPPTFTGNPALFNRRWNCSGGGIVVRRIETGVFDVRFAGNSANVGLATSALDGAVSVTRNPDRSFRVTVYSPEADQNIDVKVDKPFHLVIV